MIDHGRYPILGVRVNAVDYEAAVETIISCAETKKPCATSALAVHGVMEGWKDPVLRRRLNGLDLVVPDGQPVRWALDWLHGIEIPDRVYGPRLMLKTVEAASNRSIPVYFYGSTEETNRILVENLTSQFPELKVAGAEPSKFRRLSEGERIDLIERIRDSGARIVYAGLGCPRQEVWAYEYREALSIPILAVGAAFDFHAGLLPQAPSWMQNHGLEWLFRLLQEPKRLWHRNLVLPPQYLYLVVLQAFSIRVTPALEPTGDEPILSYG